MRPGICQSSLQTVDSLQEINPVTLNPQPPSGRLWICGNTLPIPPPFHLSPNTPAGGIRRHARSGKARDCSGNCATFCHDGTRCRIRCFQHSGIPLRARLRPPTSRFSASPLDIQFNCKYMTRANVILFRPLSPLIRRSVFRSRPTTPRCRIMRTELTYGDYGYGQWHRKMV